MGKKFGNDGRVLEYTLGTVSLPPSEESTKHTEVRGAWLDVGRAVVLHYS